MSFGKTTFDRDSVKYIGFDFVDIDQYIENK